MKWGRNKTCECGICKRCKARDRARTRYQAMSMEQRRAWTARRDPERTRAYDRARFRVLKASGDPTYELRRKAITAVNNAIRDGRLERQPCEVCGAQGQGHHDDYTRPLAVRWLCSQHHALEHV